MLEVACVLLRWPLQSALAFVLRDRAEHPRLALVLGQNDSHILVLLHRAHPSLLYGAQVRLGSLVILDLEADKPAHLLDFVLLFFLHSLHRYCTHLEFHELGRFDLWVAHHESAVGV